MSSEDPRLSDVYTARQVADLAGLQLTTIYRYLQRHAIPQPTSRIGRSPLWDKALIAEWLTTRRRRGLPGEGLPGE